MSKAPILLIDGNNVAHRAYHANNNLSYKGKSVATIFGMPQMVRSWITQFKPKKVILVWDGRKNPQRLLLNPLYKSHRVALNKDRLDFEDFNRQKTIVQRLFKYLGITQVHSVDMEADDYIYMLARDLSPKRPVIIISNDKDFHQLITEGISQFMAKPSFTELLTQYNFEHHFGMTPAQHLDYLCLTGDSSDDIAGYRGIGDVRARAFLTEHHSIEAFLGKSIQHRGIEKNTLKALYKVNKQLIGLAHFHHLYLQEAQIAYLFGLKKPRQNIERFKLLCAKYNLLTFLKTSFITTFQ